MIKIIPILFVLICLQACTNLDCTKLFDDVIEEDNFGFKLSEKDCGVFEFSYDYPSGVMIKDKFISEISMKWYLKRLGDTIFYSSDRKSYQPLFLFNSVLKNTIVKNLHNNNDITVVNEPVGLVNEEEVVLFRFKDIGCQENDVDRSSLIWCDLVICVSDKKGFLGMCMSLPKDEIYDESYNEFVYYPVGDIMQYLRGDSIKVYPNTTASARL